MQLSMFEDLPQYPKTRDDVITLIKEYVLDDEKLENVLKWNEVGGNKGDSFRIFGQKVFEMRYGKTPKLKVSYGIMEKLGLLTSKMKDGGFYTIDDNETLDLKAVLEAIKAVKQEIFEDLDEGIFCCCNDFILCSDTKECIHKKEKFSNGCSYRENLENGRIFYGKNKNI